MKKRKISPWISIVLIVTLLTVLFANISTKFVGAYNIDYSAYPILLTPVYKDLHRAIPTNESTYHIYLEDVAIQLTVPFSTTDFIASSSDEIFQMATSVQYNPFFEVSLTALPISSTELINYVLGVSPAENYTSFRQALSSTRQRQNGVAWESHEIYMFGETIQSVSNLVSLNTNQYMKEPVIIHEWVTQSGERLWIFRISYAYGDAFTNAKLQNISIDVDDSYVSSRSASQSSLGQVALSPSIPEAPNDLPFPPWWNGDCDVNNFPGSYPLGGVYNGVKACGPLGTLHEVSFGVGVPQYEWQCPELSKRYLYLAYGTPPYSAAGKEVVWNYPGTNLEKVSNGTPNKAPKPGSVLSYGSTDPNGHTSVVSAANVDGNGNGTITVIEQNWSSSGTRTHTVSNWVVQASMAVSGWLYDSSGGGACSAPSLIEPADNAVLGNRTITFRWNAVSGCTFNGYTFRVCTSSDVNNTDNCFIDTGEGNTQRTETIDGHDNQDLWWGVRAANAPAGAAWAVRRFRIEPGSSSCDPNADQIALFVDSNYSGQCVVKDVGEYSNPSAIGLPNDAISSIKVGGNVRAILCKDDNYGGGCETFTDDDANLGDNGIGDNQVSSAKVEWRSGGNCTPNADQVALFVDQNYGGPCIVKNVGEYPNPAAIGLDNDAISSVRVGSSVRAILCKDDNYGGGCETFTGDDSNLGDNGIGDNQVSSAKVEWPTPDPEHPVQLYIEPNYGGGTYCYGNNAGDYMNLDGCAGFNDAVTSILLQAGWSVRVFKDVNLSGSSRCLTGNDSDLSNNTFEDGTGLDNAMSSFSLYDQADCPTVLPPPTADFDAWPHSGVAPLTVAFHNISTGDYTDCLWEYGDGTTGTSCDSYHDHIYTSAGTYTARLTVTGPGGSNSKTIADYTTVTASTDTQKPTLNWSTPVGNEQVYQVGNEKIMLGVNATDNVGIARVQFYRWDAVNSQFVDIAEDYTSPYQITLDCGSLNYGWNQVNAAVYDSSGNIDDKYIWLDRKWRVYLPFVMR